MSMSGIEKGIIVENFLVPFVYFYLDFLWDEWGAGNSLMCPILLGQNQLQLFSVGFCTHSWSIDNLKNHVPMPDQSPCLLPGFRVLHDFLAHHVHIPEVYLIVSTFFLQTPLTELTGGPKVGSGGTPGMEWHSWFSDSTWLRQFPKTLHPYPDSLLPESCPEPFLSVAVHTPWLALQIPLTSSTSASHHLPQKLSIFISPTFRFFSFWAQLKNSLMLVGGVGRRMTGTKGLEPQFRPSL